MSEHPPSEREHDGDEYHRVSRRTVVGGIAVGAAFVTPTIVSLSTPAAAASGGLPGPNVIGNANFDTPPN